MKYSAKDFAKVKFAEHEDGLRAARSTLGGWVIESADGYIERRGDGYMAQSGWVPVSTKPTITARKFLEAATPVMADPSISNLMRFFERAGGKIILEVQWNNLSSLRAVLREVWDGYQTMDEVAEWLDKNGVKAPQRKW